MRKRKNYLITGILLIGISLLLWNCESDYEINHSQELTINKKLDYSLEKISYSDLINDKEFKKSLPFIEHRFSNKKKQDIYKRSSTQVAEGLIILTEEINRIVVEGVITWTFEIETPILESSDFENFLVKKYNDEFRYFLVSYIKDIENDENLYKKVSLYEISKEYLDITELNLGAKSILTEEIEGGSGGINECEGEIYTEPCSNGDSYIHGPESYIDGGYCSGSITILDFSHCVDVGGSTNDIPDDTSNDDQTGGGTNDSSSGGSPILTVPIYNGDISELRQNLITILEITNPDQIDWINNDDNNSAVSNIYFFGAQNNWFVESQNFALLAIEFLTVNPQFNFTQYENWFSSDYPEIETNVTVINPQSITYNIPLTQQSLPTFDIFLSNFPKLGTTGNYSQMPTTEVYTLAGGSILTSHQNNPSAYSNACSIRGSRGLLYSGIDIPVLIYNGVGQRTQKGGDNKNYILDAVSFNKFMIDKFGEATYKLEGADANNSVKVAKLLNGKNGIYIIINNDGRPKSSGGAGYSGHVDTIINGYCISGAYTKPQGGVKSIRIWELN